MNLKVVVAVSMTLAIIGGTKGFVAYDCGTSRTNYTTISLLEVGRCDMDVEFEKSEEVDIQLLQRIESHSIKFYSCKIVVNYIAWWCGDFSHGSILKNGIVSRMIPITPETCLDIHRTGVAEIYGLTLKDLRVNDTSERHVTFAGTVSDNGACTMERFSDGINTYDRATVAGSISVSLQSGSATYNIDDDKVRLRDGLTCKSEDVRCIDDSMGYVFWDIHQVEPCSKEGYYVLFEGKANRSEVFDRHRLVKETLYVVSQGDRIFALREKAPLRTCQFNLFKSDNPKIVIHRVMSGNFFFTKRDLLPVDADMFLYVNAKFAYLENHIRSSMRNMYIDILKQKCEVERKNILTKLSLAMVSPVDFAYEYMEKAGYTGVRYGEVVYIYECEPIEVSIRVIDECTMELPISYKNESYYMTPRNHLVQKHGTPISCDTQMRSHFRIKGDWYEVDGTLRRVRHPTVLHPSTNLTWDYLNAGDLMNSGIYTNNQVEALRALILYPLERKSIGERVSAVLGGEDVGNGGIRVSRLFEGNLNIDFGFWKFIHKVLDRMQYWGALGSVFICGYIMFGWIKGALSAALRMVGLYHVYGASWYLLGACWGALSTLMLTKKYATKFSSRETKGSSSGEGTSGEEEEELTGIVASAPVLSPARDKGMYPTLRSS